MLLLTFVSSHIYLTTAKPQTHDKCSVYTFCLVSVFMSFFGAVTNGPINPIPRSVCRRMASQTSDAGSISNPPHLSSSGWHSIVSSSLESTVQQ